MNHFWIRSSTVRYSTVRTVQCRTVNKKNAFSAPLLVIGVGVVILRPRDTRTYY